MLAKKGKSRFEFSAQSHAAEWVEALGLVREPERIEDHENDLKLSVKHPYWQPHIDDRALRIIEGQVELLRELLRGTE